MASPENAFVTCMQPSYHLMHKGWIEMNRWSINERQVFELLDKLRSTATGHDGLLAWFHSLGVLLFCLPLFKLFNAFSSSTVPGQWKHAWIHPVLKVFVPTYPADFQPVWLILTVLFYYVWQLCFAHLSHDLGVCPSVCLSVCHTHKPYRNVAS